MLTIDADEADRLARELAALTGETMADAVTRALQERLERVRQTDEAARILAFAASIGAHYDKRPVTKAEWDWACGDEYQPNEAPPSLE